MAPITDPDALNREFGRGPALAFEPGEGGLTRARLELAAGTAEVYLHGAHVAAWRPADQPPVLWLSRQARFAEGEPIRGGVPICFPWFGPKPDDPEAPSHGRVRQRRALCLR